MTNDRGEYRLFWLPPASYRVAAKPWYEASNYPAVNIGPPKRFGRAEQGTAPVINRRALANGAVVEQTYRADVRARHAGSVGGDDDHSRAGENASADIQLAGNRVAAHHVRGIVTNVTPGPVTIPGSQVIAVPRVPAPMVAVPSGSGSGRRLVRHRRRRAGLVHPLRRLRSWRGCDGRSM